MPFTIEPITHKHIDSVAKVIFDSFASNLGYVAVDSNNEIIAGVLCCDLKEALSFDNADDESMMAILKELNSKYFETLTVPERSYLQVKFIGVRNDHSGQGIASALINAALNNGRALGFRFVQAESAGSRSQYVFERMGFSAKASVKYDEFLFNGTKPFHATEEHQSIKLMIKKL
ncbi:GNAT family N-acetyltransferase [Vibrio harveyi]|uniref:GNAT family N-acetyltransferase n=1 Tax=Vibrio harveyi TaxID=669 RepID=UPI002ED51337|nr:GNAT family N-acetyltransferase [Vibrio harveyi]